jgi:hypothetical protein
MPSWNGFRSGLASGLEGLGNISRGSGALVGSLWGPAGIAAGGVGGNVLGSLLGGLAGLIRPGQAGGQQLSPMQQAQNELLAQLRQPTEAFNAAPLEAEAMRQFNQQIIPGISENFGGRGLLQSSGFQQALAGAGGNLASQLAAMRPQLEAQRLEFEQNRLGNLGGFLSGQQQQSLAERQLQQNGANMAQQNQFNQMLGQLGAQQENLGPLAALLQQQMAPQGTPSTMPGQMGYIPNFLSNAFGMGNNLLNSYVQGRAMRPQQQPQPQGVR